MKLAILIAVVVVGGFFTAKLSLEFLDLLVQKLKEEDQNKEE
jgi:hypothetical protein